MLVEQNYKGVHLPIKEVREAFAVMKKIVSSNMMIIPILDYFLVSLENNKCSFHCTDLHTQLTVDMGTSNQVEHYFFLVDFEKASKIASKTKGDWITFVDFEQGIEIRVEEGVFSTHRENPFDYPKPKEFKDPYLSIDFPDRRLLKEALPLVIDSLCTDDLRPAMTGLFFTGVDDKLNIVSTDGHRLTRYETDVEHPLGAHFIMHKKTAMVLQSIKGHDDQAVTIKVIEGLISTSIGPFNIIARTIDERYPDFMNAIPARHEHECIFDFSIGRLFNRIELALIMSNTTTRQIEFDFKPGSLTLVSSDLDYSSGSKQSIETASDFEVLIGFNAKFLLAALKPHKGKTATMYITAPNKAATIEAPVKYGSLTLLIMPVILNTYI